MPRLEAHLAMPLVATAASIIKHCSRTSCAVASHHDISSIQRESIVAGRPPGARPVRRGMVWAVPTTKAAPAAKRKRRKPTPRRPGRSASPVPDRGWSSTSWTGWRYGRPAWARVYDPTSELVLTILSANSADVNAEHAFELLRRRYPGQAEPRGRTGTQALPSRLGRRGTRGPGTARLGDGGAGAPRRADRRDPAGRPGGPEGADPGGAERHSPGARRLLARVPGRDPPVRPATGSRRSRGSAARPPRSCCCSRSGCR